MLPFLYTLPAREAFRSGTLELSATPDLSFAIGGVQVFPLNTVLLLVSLTLAILAMPSFFKLAPSLLDGLFRVKPLLNLEHNIHSMISRNRIAFVCFVPFFLIADKTGLYTPGFLDFIPDRLSVLGVAGMTCVFLLFRRLVFKLFEPRKLNSKLRQCVHLCPYDFFILTVIFLGITWMILFIAGCSTTAIRNVFYVEIAVMYLISCSRVTQFLMMKYSFFASILYFCALELIPVGILVSAGIIFS